MKILKAKNYDESLLLTLKESETFFNDKKKLSICMTGGNFGYKFAKFIIKKKINIFNKDFYLSDERITNCLSEKNHLKIWPIMNNLNEKNNFHNFYNENDTKALIDKTFKFNPKYHDLCFLSLGEDGHLAGHFKNSYNLNDALCFTEEAPKKPSKRISYRLDWLFHSSKIIINVMGKKKLKAFDEFYNLKKFHYKNYLKSSGEVVIITDLVL